MNDISDAAVLSALRRQMTIAAAKQAVAAGNLANINTPGYKAQEADFSETLERQARRRRRAEDDQHPPPAGRRDRRPRRDEGSRRPRRPPRRQHRAGRSRAARR